MADNFQGDWKKGHRDDAPLFFANIFCKSFYIHLAGADFAEKKAKETAKETEPDEELNSTNETSRSDTNQSENRSNEK